MNSQSDFLLYDALQIKKKKKEEFLTFSLIANF